jgi:DNA-binding winged helix-turn-helix (wHTH) protein
MGTHRGQSDDRASAPEYLLDIATRQLSRKGTPLHVEPKVMDLLLYLARHSERCVSRQELKAEIWPGVAVSPGSLTRLVVELRKAFSDSGGRPDVVRTVHGHGYQFVGLSQLALRRAPARLSLDAPAPGELCKSPGLSKTLMLLERVAAHGLPVALHGETGTGKECVARAVHAWSGRCGALVIVRCTGVSPMELKGALAQAAGADTTLVLDEIEDLPLPLQGQLLAAIAAEDISNRRALCRRTIVTSQRPLLGSVGAGALRADLLGRLDGISAELPPLRNRREDILAFVDFFLDKWRADPAEHPSPLVRQSLSCHDWPFNVRELQMFLLRWLAVSRAGLEPGIAMPLFRQTRSQPGEAGIAGAR